MDDVNKILMREHKKEFSKQKRTELLQVATQLAAGDDCRDVDFSYINKLAVEQAKHLISLVDKEFEQ